MLNDIPMMLLAKPRMWGVSRASNPASSTAPKKGKVNYYILESLKNLKLTTKKSGKYGVDIKVDM